MPTLEQLAVGDEVAAATYRFTRDSLVRYAGASGDFNDIHYRDDVAVAVGLPGVLAHGMLTMGVAVQPVVEWLGDPGRVLGYQVKFAVTAEEQSARIDLTVTFNGDTVLGKAQVLVSFATPA
jgi:acyl dehydratase